MPHGTGSDNSNRLTSGSQAAASHQLVLLKQAQATTTTREKVSHFSQEPAPPTPATAMQPRAFSLAKRASRRYMTTFRSPRGERNISFFYGWAHLGPLFAETSSKSGVKTVKKGKNSAQNLCFWLFWDPITQANFFFGSS